MRVKREAGVRVKRRKDIFGVALAGAGAFGGRRAAAVGESARTRLLVVADPEHARAAELADSFAAEATTSWQQAVERDDVDIVVIATPPAIAPEICLCAIHAGKHVLVEKPFGRAAREILPAVKAAEEANVRLKVGYNHRYHRGVAKAHELFRDGALGRPLFLRCTYGHGGRPGYEREWRSHAAISGGGELLDQGVHALDLFRWFAGEFSEATAFLSTSYWPIAPVEDNVFALLRTEDGVVAQLHASWTQWRNTFSFEVAGELGSLGVSGLGRSYGPEKLIYTARASAGGPPQEACFEFGGKDESLSMEWCDFVDAIEECREPMSSGADAWRTLQLAEAVYESARERRIASLGEAWHLAGAAQAAGARNA
jgi:predicted dehydrogenase